MCVELLIICYLVIVELCGLLILVVFVLIFVFGYGLFFVDFGWIEIGFVVIGFMLLLIFFGVYIVVVLILFSFFGIWLICDNLNVVMWLLVLVVDGVINCYFFGVVFLFVFMGLIVDIVDIGCDVYCVVVWMFQKFKGGFGMVIVVVNVVFVFIIGILIVLVVVFLWVVVLQMVVNGYNNCFVFGVVVGFLVFGMLILFSFFLIIYGVLVE